MHMQILVHIIIHYTLYTALQEPFLKSVYLTIVRPLPFFGGIWRVYVQYTYIHSVDGRNPAPD